MSEEQTIVAEVSKNWLGTDRLREAEAGLLSQRFEKVIAVNAARGYVLRDWRFSTVAVGGGINETIVAIFDRNSR